MPSFYMCKKLESIPLVVDNFRFFVFSLVGIILHIFTFADISNPGFIFSLFYGQK